MIRKIVYIFSILCIIIIGYSVYKYQKNKNPNPKYFVGQRLDSLNGVYVFYNARVSHVGKRNTTNDGYNIGLKYQCVEFVKRYYYEHYNHKMPNSFGNAKDFFNDTISDGILNMERNLFQFTNPSATPPIVGDLIIFDGHAGNKYGHVAIISDVNENKVQIIQQNPGPFAKSRIDITIIKNNNKYFIDNKRVLGWLRK